MAGAFETGVYRNVFMECGIPEEEIEKKVSDTFRTMFYGKEEERIYHEAGQDCGFLTDTGNNDVRTEGMSYGMTVSYTHLVVLTYPLRVLHFPNTHECLTR